MTDSDVNKLLESCDDSTAVGLRDRAFLEFLYATRLVFLRWRLSSLNRLICKMEQCDFLVKGSKANCSSL